MKDPTEFRQRFADWKAGERVYDAGKPVEDDYEKFKQTLPPNQRNASEYDYSTRRYWELNGKPKDFDEAVKRKMYTLEDDGFYHANSIAWTPNGDAEFMKPNVHTTKHFEDEFYESNPKFQKKYRRTVDWTRPGFSKYERNINPLDYINLPKYDGGTDGNNYDTENPLDTEKQIDWMRNWLKARRNVLEKNADAVGYGYSKYTPKNTTGDVRDAGWNVKMYDNLWNPFAYFNDSTPTRNRINKIIYSQIENAQNVPKTSVGAGVSDDYNMRGVYVEPDYWDNSGNYVAFAGVPDPDVIVHELTHASHPEQQERYILNNIFDGRVPQVVPLKRNTDLQNAKELYGALQQFRYKNKLDPKYKVTQEWINKNRNLFKGTYLENIKDQDKLKLFNDAAQNNINTKRLYYADKGKSIKPLHKYDDGTDDKTYLPEYEYEATVTPQGTSLEKHKRITNEEDWQKYWGNVGAGYVNQEQNQTGKQILDGLKELSYFTPLGAFTSVGDAIAAHMNGGSPEEILSATVGALPEVRFANNVGRFARYANVADDMIQINPELLQMLQEGDFVTKRKFGSTALGKIEDVLRNSKMLLRQKYANAKRQLLGTAVKNRKILPKSIQSLVDNQIDNQHLKEYWSGPFAFDQPEYRQGDMTALSYFNMSPKDVMESAMRDMNDIPIGNRFLVNSLSTDSYPLVVHMLDSKISPNFRLNPVTDRIVLNGMGNLHGQAAVDRINKKLQQLELQRGVSLGRAKRYVSPIGEEQITAPFLTAERLYDKGKSIHIKPANRGKFKATMKRTGKSAEELSHSKNPLTRKRAIFALNSRKFKH